MAMKIPWQSSAIIYRTVDGECVAQCEATFIFVREVAQTLSASQLKGMDANQKAFIQKLRECPFMVVDDVAYNCEGALESWDQYAVITSPLHMEDQCVYANVAAPMTFYTRCASGSYTFQNAGSVFCKTLCMPLKFDPAIAPRLQKYRDKSIESQVQSERIFLGDRGTYNCYSAADFTMLHSLHNVH
jgi:hypothetical protein